MKKFGFLLVLIALFAMAGASLAANHDVTTWATLVTAYGAATNGDTITLPENGTFTLDGSSTFPLLINRNVSVKFIGRGTTINAASAPNTDVGPAAYGVFSLQQNPATSPVDIEFDNIKIKPGPRGADKDAAVGILVANMFKGKVSIRGCTFEEKLGNR